MKRHRRSDFFEIEVSFLKMCKIHPEILEMDKIEYIASFITANMFELVDDGTSFDERLFRAFFNTKILSAFWKAAVEADQIDLKTLSELIRIGKQDKYEKQVIAKNKNRPSSPAHAWAALAEERAAGGW